MTKIEFKTLTAEHLPEVMKIEKASFSDPWPESAFRDLMIQFRTNWVAVQEDRVTGFLVTQWVLDEIHILNLAVVRRGQRAGVASQILDFLIAVGKRRKMRDLFLEVRESNIAAQKLYEKFGFTLLSMRKAYYPDGENALILHKRIPRDQ